jgi:hypothetical protein
MSLNRSFFLLTIAFFTTGAAIIGVAVSGSHTSSAALLFIFACAAISGVILWVEGRRDLDAVLVLMAAVLVLAFLCIAVYVMAALKPGGLSRISAALCAIGAVACVVVTWRRQRSASSTFPNVLGAKFPPGQIFETDGVQFTGFLTPGASGKPHFASVVLQNSFDSRRKVTVRLDAASHAKYLRFPPTHTVDLGAAEVARVVLPVVTPTYPGTYHLYFSVAVDGTTGKRVRLWRAQEASHRTTATETVALVAIGVLKWGGGIRFNVGPLPDDLWAAPLPMPVFESIWRPAIGTVPLEPSIA